jgi:hypothetical protein
MHPVTKHPTGTTTPARRFARSVVRALPLAVTLAVHLLVLLMLTRPGEPRRQHGAGDDPVTDALQIRWIEPPAPQPAKQPPASLVPRPRVRHAGYDRSVATPPQPSPSPPAPASAPALRLTLPDRTAAGYVPGGGELGNALDVRRHLPRLPGRTAVPHAPVFRMIDPRTRGVAGVVHLLGTLTGAVDPKCIQLDKWQRMSVQERGARHITDKAMADIEREHGCIPPPARVGPGSNPLTGP